MAGLYVIDGQGGRRLVAAAALPDPGTPPHPDGDYVPGSGPQTQYMGPIGRWPAHTPPYNTPATIFVSSLSQVSAALASASSGDVIEVTGSPGGGSITGGSDAWAQNVLVRPPLGQRGAVASGPTLGASSVAALRHVTLAGFHLTAQTWVRNCVRSAIAWTTAGPGVILSLRGCDRFQWCEVVRRGRDPSRTSSQIVMFRDDAMNVTDLLYLGCWLDGGESIKDNSQNLSNGHSYEFRSCVMRTGCNKMHESNGNFEHVRWANCWSDNQIPADINNGGDYDWSLNSGSNPVTGTATINLRGGQVLVEDGIHLGSVRLQRGVGTFRNSVMRAVSDVPQWPDDTTDLTVENVNVSESHFIPDFPVPFGFSGPSDGYLDSVWHP